MANFRKCLLKISCALPCLCALIFSHCAEVPGYGTLTVEISPPDCDKCLVSRNPAGPDSEYENGTRVTLTAVPGQGYRFSGWSGDTTGTASSITVTISGDKKLTAGFAKQ
jgi:uncharacterized repeat protein (TIGR02543 family)